MVDPTLFKVPTKVEFEGVPYTFHPLDAERQARFAAWLEREAFEAVFRARQHLDESEMDRIGSRLVQDIAAGLFSFGSVACAKALATPKGVHQVLTLCLDPVPSPEVIDRVIAASVASFTPGGESPK